MSFVTSPKLQENPPFLSLKQQGTGRFPHPLYKRAFPSPVPGSNHLCKKFHPPLTPPLSQTHCLQVFPKNAVESIQYSCFQVFPHPHVTPGLYLVTCQTVISLLHATSDLSSKINTIHLVAVISFQILPSTAVVVANYLFYLGLKCATFQNISRQVKLKITLAIASKQSFKPGLPGTGFTAALKARRFLYSCSCISFVMAFGYNFCEICHILFYLFFFLNQSTNKANDRKATILQSKSK